jgi:uncharacterized protein
MPEYLAPGVYVEETSYRDKSISGASTSTAAFIGPARFGPPRGKPELLTSLADYTRIYGDLEPLVFDGDVTLPNYLGQALRGFFTEGGSLAYVMRVEVGAKNAWSFIGDAAADPNEPPAAPGTEPAGDPPNSVLIQARYPGAMGSQMQVTVGLKVGAPLGATPAFAATDLLAGFKEDGSFDWLVADPSNAAQLATTTDGKTYTAAAMGDYERISSITIEVAVSVVGSNGKAQFLYGQSDLGLHPDHPSALPRVFAAEPPNRATELYVPLTITYSGNPFVAVFGTASDTRAKDALTRSYAVNKASLTWTAPVYVQLKGGADGARPADYTGGASAQGKTGFEALADLDDISIVAAPGSTYGYLKDSAWQPNALNIQGQLLTHCENMKYRVAVLDAPDGAITGDIVGYRQKLRASSYGALYYPWVTIMDPVSGKEMAVPPSGLIAGIYARNDSRYDVSKAPANEPVNLAIGLPQLINKGQQDLLNPMGINCIRFFPGKGYLVWGARTISSDTDWTYINARRYLVYLEHSIDNGTQWAVFMNNGPDLWKQVVSTITGFLYNEWANGRLMGDSAAQAFFVKCDRTTMTQNDLDNGRLICEIGVSIFKPAEFVIFRIGQWVSGS